MMNFKTFTSNQRFLEEITEDLHIQYGRWLDSHSFGSIEIKHIKLTFAPSGAGILLVTYIPTK